jgi:hypothetical protein
MVLRPLDLTWILTLNEWMTRIRCELAEYLTIASLQSGDFRVSGYLLPSWDASCANAGFLPPSRMSSDRSARNHRSLPTCMWFL